MLLRFDHITVTKTADGQGYASIKLEDEDGNSLFLNRFVIDLNDSANPISVLKSESVPVYSGSIVDVAKEEILENFQDYLIDAPPGMYKITPDEVKQIA